MVFEFLSFILLVFVFVQFRSSILKHTKRWHCLPTFNFNLLFDGKMCSICKCIKLRLYFFTSNFLFVKGSLIHVRLY